MMALNEAIVNVPVPFAESDTYTSPGSDARGFAKAAYPGYTDRNGFP